MAIPHEDPVLIAYDGSVSARHAIEHTARLFLDRPAVVLTVWTSVREAAGAARAALPSAVISEAVRNLDTAAESEASEIAEQGAELARSLGLSASATTMLADPSVAGSIIRAAEEAQALAVVVGSRGRSAIKSALLGSVSNAVVHGCRRPVVVIHPPGADSGDQ